MTLQRNSEIEAAPLDQELLLFDPAANKFYVMNTTAAYLWEVLAVPSDEEGLARSVCANFAGIDPDTALADVKEAVQYMTELGLIFRGND